MSASNWVVYKTSTELSESPCGDSGGNVTCIQHCRYSRQHLHHSYLYEPLNDVAHICLNSNKVTLKLDWKYGLLFKGITWSQASRWFTCSTSSSYKHSHDLNGIIECILLIFMAMMMQLTGSNIIKYLSIIMLSIFIFLSRKFLLTQYWHLSNYIVIMI